MNIMRLLMLALAVSATPSYATVIFSDQFGTQATGADASLSADVGSWGSLGSTSTGTIFSPVTDIGNVMGSGTNNGILHVQDLSSSGNVGMQATFSQAASYGTISFDFYQSIVDNTVTSGNRYFRIQLVSGATEAYRMDFLNTGNYMRTPSPYFPSGTFSQENLIHIDMYFNSTNSAMTVGSVTLNAQSFLLYQRRLCWQRYLCQQCQQRIGYPFLYWHRQCRR